MKHYLLFVLMATATVFSPGPGVIMTLTNSLRHGLYGTFGGIFGIATGAFFVAAISATSIGFVLATSALAFTVMKYVGAAYLFYLGIKLWRAPAFEFKEAAAAGAGFGRRFKEKKKMKKSFTNSVWLFLFIALAVQPLPAQSPSANALADEAEKLFQAKDWPNAVKAYERVAKQEPANFLAWNRLGAALHTMAKYDQAAKAYEQAAAINSSSPITKYNLACAYSRANEKDKTLALLSQLASTGIFTPEQFSADEDLANLRDEARFKELLALAQKSSRPCTASPEFRQLDFWIGEWDVQSSGQPVGKSSVQLILDECVIFENWTGGLGGTGKSFNIYNSSRKKWQQTWVSNKGNITEYAGEFKDDKMEFHAESVGPNGNKVMQRLTFFNLGPDRVRQFSESSSDEGKTWNVQYDFTYIRKK